MRLEAALTGDLRKHIGKEWRKAGRAIRSGLREAANGIKADLRADAEAADLGRLAKVWRVRVYGGKRGPWESSALIFPKGGERTRGALWAFEHGATIRSTNARYLLVPTAFNRKGGRRGGKVLYKADELKDTFVQRSKGGNLLMFARVAKAQQKVKGRVRDRAYVGDRLLGGGRVKRTEKILQAGAVPMFVLVPQIRVTKRLNRAGIVRKWELRVPALIIKRWNEDDGR